MANDAVTPPVVGIGQQRDVRDFGLSRRASAAEILASCIRLMTPSIMRAPPDAETMISGVLRVGRAFSMARVMRFSDDRAHAAADEGILHHARHRPDVPSICPAR